MSNENIGLYLKELRTKKGLTQRELAKEIGLTHQAISRWENGKSIPDVDVLRILAKFYDVSVDEILQVSKNTTKPKKQKYISKILVSILIVFNVLCILQFLLFERTLLTTIIYTIFISLFLISGLFFIKKYYNIFLITLTILVFVIIGILNQTNNAYYDLDYIPRYMEIDNQDISLGTLGGFNYHYFGNDQSVYLLGWTESQDMIYIYDLNQDIHEFETIIELDGYEIYDVVGTYDGVYASVQVRDSSPVRSMILYIDIYTKNYEIITGTEKSDFASKIYALGEFLHTLENQELSMYVRDEETFFLMHEFDVDINDIVEHIDGYTISYCNNGYCNVYKASYTFLKLFDYFDQDLGTPLELDNGYQKVVAYGMNSSYFLYEDGTIEETNIYSYNTNSRDDELINGFLYQDQVLVNDFSFITNNFEKRIAEIYLSETSYGNLFFNNGNVVKAEFYPREIDFVLINHNIREIIFYSAMFTSIVTIAIYLGVKINKKNKIKNTK
ncbi:helix-turn-helix domain-containing protein [Candidatus Izemoplasma sp. B36]|uniref:helix-turn-helix domain-containing protein n=1 Tax=Candidatus Izemoplasma sp. B36 TaxID=3242468 RepID=UPI003556946B